MTGFNKQAGFTLLELLVALTVLSIVLIIVASFTTRLTFLQRRDIGEQTIQEDVRLALEVFNREARLAYASTFAIANGQGTNIVMRNQNGACVSYALNADNHSLERAEAGFGGVECVSAPFQGRYASLTSQRVHIDSIRFDIPDSIYNVPDARLDRQGFITLMITAHPTNTGGVPLQLQTTVTSRQIKPYEPL